MTINRTICLCICALASADVYGQGNTIVQWNSQVPGTAYAIEQGDATITILTPGGHDFKFYAVNSSGNPGSGVINNIEVLQTATGNCTLLVQHSGGGSGAAQWKAGKLTYTGGTCTITGINVGEALLPYDPPGSDPVVQNIFCGPIKW